MKIPPIKNASTAEERKQAANSASFGFTFETKNEVYTYLYAMFHGAGLCNAQIVVYNPTANNEQSTYLREDQAQLATKSLDQFILFCEELVVIMNVPCIGIAGGIFCKNSVRVGVQAHFDPAFTATCGNTLDGIADNEIPIFCTVGGASSAKNEKICKEIEAKADKEFERLWAKH